jgi:phage/plasmid-like protein (TIGR03299 family)
MSHELEITSKGAAGFFVKQKPWHKLGTILDSPPSVIEGIKLAQLDWTVSLHNLQTPEGIEVPNRAVIRSTDQAVLGVVGPSYTPLQNAQAFEWFQPFIDGNVAQLESAGALFGGRRIWVLAKIQSNNLVIGKGDEVEKYILLSNAHDGTAAVQMGFTPIRVVCNNTLMMATTSARSQLIRVFHVGDVKSNIEVVRETMDIINQEFGATEEAYKRLAKMPINTSDLKAYVKKVFKRDVTTEEEAAESQGEREGRILTTVIQLFEEGQGANLKTAKGTYWGAYNAVIEYLSYHQGKNEDSRLGNLWFRGSKKLNQKALAAALAAA